MHVTQNISQLTRVAAVDDHNLFLAGLGQLLNDPGNGIMCTGFESGLTLLRALDEGAEFDVIVTDLTMKDLNGLALISAIRARKITSHCIILTASEDALSKESSAMLGAYAFLHKSDDPETLIQAIKTASTTKQPRPQVASKVAAQRIESESGEDRAVLPTLGPRQLRVLALIGEGASNRDISDALCISENTVKTHMRAIFRELGVKSRTAAANRARELSLI